MFANVPIYWNTVKYKLLSIFIITVTIATTFSCTAKDGAAPINTDSNGLAARGYDAVAFFADNSAVRGNPTYEYVWSGAKWVFATAANLDRFKKDPESFAPQFGGYCAYSAAQGKLVEGNPEHYKVVDGKLYFCNNAEAKQALEQDEGDLLKKAEKFWAGIQAK